MTALSTTLRDPAEGLSAHVGLRNTLSQTMTLAWRATSPVSVVVSDSRGAKVRTLVADGPTEGSVSWDGRLFDCDFNQMLDLDAAGAMSIETFDFDRWQKRSVVTRAHCFGCTAGAGSSCGGSTA